MLEEIQRQEEEAKRMPVVVEQSQVNYENMNSCDDVFVPI